MEKLKFGMVGGGNGAFIGDVHRHGAIMDNLSVLAAGCFSRNKEKSLETASLWDLADMDRVYSDYMTMAKMEGKRPDGIDYVIIATPNNTHYEIAKAFMNECINVVCDKPLTLTVKEAEDLEKLALENDLLFGVTYTYSGYAMIRQAREMIDRGEIGNITCIQGECLLEWMAVAEVEEDSTLSGWRQDPSQSGESGCLADIGTHMEGLIGRMTGLHPRKVIARFDNIPKTSVLETNAMVMCEYEGNVPGMIFASQVSVGHETELIARIYGDKGSIEWTHLKPWELRVTKINEPPRTYTNSRDYLYPSAGILCRLPSGHVEGFYEAFGNIYRSFCTNLLAKKRGEKAENFSYPTVSDGVKGIRFVEACIKSNKNNNIWVEV